MPDFSAPRLEKLPSQPDVQKLLKGLLDHPGVQTFLWVGPEGVGKKTYALALVRSLFCQEGPDCPGCPTCKQVLNLTHPDLFWVDKGHFWSEKARDLKTDIINVDVITELSGSLNRSPLSAPFKVAIIPDAEKINDPAQDKFLKTLEEPPNGTLVILLARKTGDFLPTVLSRCRLVRFPALPVSTVETILCGCYKWEKSEARKAAQEANGNLTLALKMGKRDWAQFRDKVCSDFDRALQGPDGEWLALGNEYDKWEPDFLGEAEKTATQRKAEVLKAALQVYLGLWSLRLSGEAKIPPAFTSVPADSVLKCIQKHQDMIPTNLAVKMIMDHLFMELRDGFQKGELLDRSFMELSTQI